MSMIFYHYEVPEDSVLYRSFVMRAVFIVYNPADGETAFFEVWNEEVRPFGPAAMKYVAQRYQDFKEVWPIEKPEQFDQKAHDEFIKGLR